MTCFICGAAAHRSCTQCGRFCCREHAGMRLGSSGASERWLCDRCAPSQVGMQLLRWLPLAVLGIVALAAVLLALVLEMVNRGR